MSEQGFNAVSAPGEGTAVVGTMDNGPRLARVGEVVGYVLEDGKGEGEVRPAIVVHNWDGELIEGYPGTLQLQVFTDGDGGEYNDGLPNVVWRTSVMFSEEKMAGTWHWLD